MKYYGVVPFYAADQNLVNNLCAIIFKYANDDANNLTSAEKDRVRLILKEGADSED